MRKGVSIVLNRKVGAKVKAQSRRDTRFTKTLVVVMAIAVLAVTVLAVIGCGGTTPEVTTPEVTTPETSPETTAPGVGSSEGISDDEILLGSMGPRTGPITQFATGNATIEMIFKEINAQGGIKFKDGKTRQINFVWYDDAYNPQKAVEQGKRLVEKDHVFAVITSIGTPTNMALRPYLNANGVPHVLVGSGSTVWGSEMSEYPWTVGWQPNYAGEANILVRFLKRDHPEVKTVAMIYQNDDFGQDYAGSFMRAAEEAGLSVVGLEGFERTDTSIQAQIIKLAATKADVFMNAATPSFAAQAIKAIHGTDWQPVHLLASIAGSTSNMKAAGDDAAEGVYSPTYAGDPLTPSFRDSDTMKEFLAMYEKYKPEFLNPDDMLSIDAWSRAEIVAHVLSEMPELTRESFMDTLMHVTALETSGLLPGIKTTYNGLADPFGIESEWMQQYRDGSWHLIGDGPITDFEGSNPEPGIEYFKSHR